MPANRNALIRYKTIDICLQNRYRLWTLEDLIDACSDALYEYEGIDKGVSRRTIQGDIQMMRSDKLGYNAPIIVNEKKYYTYAESDYSITNIPITEQDLNKLNESVEFLKQFKGFSHFKDLDGMIQKLEDHVYAQKSKETPIIDFEKNENLKGLEHLDILYQIIKKKQTARITYKSFKARNENTFTFHPYQLKEFRNRWFLVGMKRKKEHILTLALDRMESVERDDKPLIIHPDFDSETYFKHAIGVTVSPNLKPEKVLLWLTHKHAPYILTKPFHWSQRIVEKDNFGITIQLDVQLNFELEKEILSLGEFIKVIEPVRLRRNIKDRLIGAVDLYETEINGSAFQRNMDKLKHKGYTIFKRMYSTRECRRLSDLLDKYTRTICVESFIFDIDLESIKGFKDILLGRNLTFLMHCEELPFSLRKIEYYQFPIDDHDQFLWHQDKVSPERAELVLWIYLNESDSKNNPLQLIPGSQKNIHSTENLSLISENAMVVEKELPAGGAIVMSPLVIHRFKHPIHNRRIRVLKLILDKFR